MTNMAALDVVLESSLESDPPSNAPVTVRRLDDSAKQEIDRLYRRGISPDVLAARFNQSRARVDRVITELRAKRICEHTLDFMPDPSFETPGIEAEILAALPEPAAGKARRSKPPEGLPPYLASLYDVPLLSREQEAHLFRKMNYLKYRVNKMREAIDPTRVKPAVLDEIERLQEEALAVKNQIIRANLRLVVSIAKKHLGPANNFFELVSDGNMSLIRAVEKFDYARGNKFSTYASWAIMRNYIRSIPEEKHRRDRFVTGHEEMFEAAADHRTDEHEYEAAQRRTREAVQGLLGRLSDRERRVLTSRFGLEGTVAHTLEQLGQELGVTKERVRQIESRAQEKLRKIAIQENLELPTI
jgi:RNA polymerase primary sigma factor